MIPALQHAREIRRKFFAPTLPIVRFTRAEIDGVQISESRRTTREIGPHPALDRRPLSPAGRRILSVAATMYGITVDDLLGSNRFKIFTLARTYAVRRLIAEEHMSIRRLARLFQRDRSTIINLVRPRRKRTMATIPTIPVARQNLAAISPAYRNAVKELERVAREIGFGHEYSRAFEQVQREARKAEAMVAARLRAG